MYKSITDILCDERGGCAIGFLPLLAAASGLGLLATHGGHLVPNLGKLPDTGDGLMPASGLAGTACILKEYVSLERNFAREVGLFNPPHKVKQAKVKEWNIDQTENTVKQLELDVTGYQDGQRVVYIPAQFIHLFDKLPAARLALAALTTLWLQNGEGNMAIKTTLGELCRTVGLAPNGPNRMRMKEALTILHHVRYQGLNFFNQEVTSRNGKVVKIKGCHEVMTILVPHLEFLDAVMDGKRRDSTVIVDLCPPLTRALALNVPKARVPVAALQATYGNTRATRGVQNILFWLSAVTPEKPGQPLRPKVDTLIEVMKVEGRRKDKNIRKLKRTLNSLQKSGFIAWWKIENEYCVIMKNRDQGILEKKRERGKRIVAATLYAAYRKQTSVL